MRAPHRPAWFVSRLAWRRRTGVLLGFWLGATLLCARAGQLAADFRYAPVSWQTAICLPDDPHKLLIGKDGDLRDGYPGPFGGFGLRINADADGGTVWQSQRLLSPRIPIMQTVRRAGPLQASEEAFVVPEKNNRLWPANSAGSSGPAILRLNLKNSGSKEIQAAPSVRIDSAAPLTLDSTRALLRIGAGAALAFSAACERIATNGRGATLIFPKRSLAPGERLELALEYGCGQAAPGAAPTLSDAARARARAIGFWQRLDLPYDRIQTPDPVIQALLDSAIRNIYQAREIKKGLPAFQVGPTCYRGLWVVDGSFIMEAMAFLGRTNEARRGIDYLLSFQRPDGGFQLIDGHWKETGIALWAITRHAQLTGDRAWLEGVWPKVESAVAYIERLRKTAAADPAAPNFDLMPAGFSDGGLGGKYPEYTNIYWSLAGLRAAIAAARELGRLELAEQWEKEYGDFWRRFRAAAERDARADPFGNRYLPIRMGNAENAPPQKGQWAFLHAIFPGKIFAANDPLVLGNLAMLRACEKEGLVQDTGWLKDGIWNYFASFYAHAWLWQGDGQKAARTLYAFANHASPLLVWREEQALAGGGPQMVGDMPHNWASAEFIRLVRDLLVLERGGELHLFQGCPPCWAQPGDCVALRGIMTEFGPISLEFAVAHDGKRARLKLDPPRRGGCQRIIWHLGGWSGRTDALDLPTRGPSEKIITLAPPL